MRTISIDTEKPYQVCIGSGLMRELGSLVKQVHKPCRAAVVTDSTVGPLYGAGAERALEKAGFAPCRFTFPAGERSKRLGTFEEAVRFFAVHELTRSDLVVALGGGVAGDLAGFAAACWQRGVPFVQVPTSMLCAFDASVGGKTAVDLEEGKNLVGAFHQPILVVCDTDTFATLDAVRVADGAAESIKHGLIADAALFESMRTGKWLSDLEAAVEANVRVKRSFVVGDELDRGMRQLLNFGHTIGHAVEALSGYALSHGQAVAIGMVAEMRAARRMGFGAVHESIAQEACLAAGLPVACSFSAEQVYQAALGDKKRAGDRMTVGALKKTGEGFLQKLDMEAFRRFCALGVEA